MECKTKILTTTTEFKKLKREWNELLAKSESDNLFLTHDWLETWLATVNPKGQLFIILVYQDTKLIGIAPFYKSRTIVLRILNFRALRILGDKNSSSEYQDVIVHRSYADIALEHLAKVLKHSTSDCDFAWIPYSADFSGASKRLNKMFNKAGFNLTSRQIAYYRIALPENNSAFDSMLKSKQRNNIKRYRQSLKTSAPLRLQNLADIMVPADVISILQRLHNQRWAAKNKEGVFERDPLFKDFMLEYARLAAKNQQLSAYCLYRGEEAIAIRFGFTYKKVLYEIQSGFDPSLNGAGIVVIDMAIKEAIKCGAEFYDFLAFEGEYKKRFGATEKPGSRIFATKKSLIGKIVRYLGLWPTGKYLTLD
ncbi:MAG: CelD/BcsL family acetyltransferase involved in cellulose biosynthesis [Candidatus Azotimanducaceae bacterium]|jgi:CelD/BcsL family acetyltransferase involved in cellulose biosynthesis